LDALLLLAVVVVEGGVEPRDLVVALRAAAADGVAIGVAQPVDVGQRVLAEGAGFHVPREHRADAVDVKVGGSRRVASADQPRAEPERMDREQLADASASRVE
jgi:hypothetical protein